MGETANALKVVDGARAFLSELKGGNNQLQSEIDIEERRLNYLFHLKRYTQSMDTYNHLIEILSRIKYRNNQHLQNSIRILQLYSYKIKTLFIVNSSFD
jgi:hypothetical protein